MWQMIPHTLCLLAAVVRDLCEVEIIDANKESLSEDEFVRRLVAGGYDLVGVSVLMDLFSAAGHLAVSLAKLALPETVTVMGGVYATMNPSDAMKNTRLDYVCLGEGEEVLPELIRHLFHNGKMPERGLAYRAGGQTIIQPKAAFIQELDALPRPAYDLVNFASYANWYPRKSVDGPPLLPYVDLMTSRGCPQSCCFCQAVHISGHRVRVRSSGRVLDEMAYFRENYGVRSLVFVDDNLLAARPRAMEIFRGMVDRNLKMPWKANAIAVFRLDEFLLDTMAESGCQYICVAIESGSPRVLRD
ncbi:MAG: B12-binding domain-containing radical SAM protein, partial [Planctomycetota bacterium]|nr:B12-binding domain-containing radical SAM protein [Planctomycetota bacterium]